MIFSSNEAMIQSALMAAFSQTGDGSGAMGAEPAWPVGLAYGIEVSVVLAKKIVGRGRLNRLFLAIGCAPIGCTLIGCAALAMGACGRNVDLGAIGDGAASLLWTATFEPGDLSEWLGDGEGGTFADNTTLSPSATTGLAHTGHFAGSVTLSPNGGMPSTGYLFRNQPSPREAYYSAWFYIPSSFTVTTWLSLTHFRGSRTGDGNNLFALWDVNLYPLVGGGLAAQLYNYVTLFNLQQVAPVPVPLDRWVQFEIFFSKATGTGGRIAVWQDGTLILDRTGIATVQNDWLQWDAGGAADNVVPSPATVYLDDAAISLIRLGP